MGNDDHNEQHRPFAGDGRPAEDQYVSLDAMNWEPPPSPSGPYEPGDAASSSDQPPEPPPWFDPSQGYPGTPPPPPPYAQQGPPPGPYTPPEHGYPPPEYGPPEYGPPLEYGLSPEYGPPPEHGYPPPPAADSYPPPPPPPQPPEAYPGPVQDPAAYYYPPPAPGNADMPPPGPPPATPYEAAPYYDPPAYEGPPANPPPYGGHGYGYDSVGDGAYHGFQPEEYVDYGQQYPPPQYPSGPPTQDYYGPPIQEDDGYEQPLIPFDPPPAPPNPPPPSAPQGPPQGPPQAPPMGYQGPAVEQHYPPPMPYQQRPGVAPPGQAPPGQAPPWQQPGPPGGTPQTADSLNPETLLRGRKRAPSHGWRRAVYKASGGAVRPGESPAERRRRELVHRVRTPVAGGHHRVAVMSLKGGVGKTTTTVGLGATLASLRGDRVIAVDANPDRGTLSDRVRLETAATVRDLLSEREQIQRYADVRAFTTQAPSRLEVLASDRDEAASEAFSETDYRQVTEVLEHYYSICITDCGTGLLHSAMAGVLGLANQIILVSSPSVDGARSASATLDWLIAHDYHDLVRSAVVVLSTVRPKSKSTVDIDRLERHFAYRCRAVVRVPYDPHLEEGAEVDLERLRADAHDAYLRLAATVGDGFALS